MLSQVLCQDFCKCYSLSSHTCGYHHPHLPKSLWHRCWILGLIPWLCSWGGGSLEVEFPHSCPQPALGWASDELSAFDLRAWLSSTGHDALTFQLLYRSTRECCFHHFRDEPGRGSAPNLVTSLLSVSCHHLHLPPQAFSS